MLPDHPKGVTPRACPTPGPPCPPLTRLPPGARSLDEESDVLAAANGTFSAQHALEEMEEAEEAEHEVEELEDLLDYYLQRAASTQTEAERLLAGARDLEESIGVSLSARRFEVRARLVPGGLPAGRWSCCVAREGCFVALCRPTGQCGPLCPAQRQRDALLRHHAGQCRASQGCAGLPLCRR